VWSGSPAPPCLVRLTAHSDDVVLPVGTPRSRSSQSFRIQVEGTLSESARVLDLLHRDEMY
jgi:hypothetical protein